MQFSKIRRRALAGEDALAAQAEKARTLKKALKTE
jgi:hypothetical protein